MSDTTDALESLVQSPGWGYLADLARREWAERERKGVKAVISKDGEDAVEKLRQIVAAREAVEWVLGLPNERMRHLRKLEPEGQTTSQVIRALVPERVMAENRRGGL